jgi:hypothetical protein
MDGWIMTVRICVGGAVDPSITAFGGATSPYQGRQEVSAFGEKRLILSPLIRGDVAQRQGGRLPTHFHTNTLKKLELAGVISAINKQQTGRIGGQMPPDAACSVS